MKPISQFTKTPTVLHTPTIYTLPFTHSHCLHTPIVYIHRLNWRCPPMPQVNPHVPAADFVLLAFFFPRRTETLCISVGNLSPVCYTNWQSESVCMSTQLQLGTMVRLTSSNKGSHVEQCNLNCCTMLFHQLDSTDNQSWHNCQTGENRHTPTHTHTHTPADVRKQVVYTWFWIPFFPPPVSEVVFNFTLECKYKWIATDAFFSTHTDWPINLTTLITLNKKQEDPY